MSKKSLNPVKAINNEEHRDNLSGTSYVSLLGKIFMAPGKAILWFKYMNPPSGKGSYAKTRAVARQARSPLYTAWVSLCFWVGSAALIGAVLVGELAR